VTEPTHTTVRVDAALELQELRDRHAIGQLIDALGLWLDEKRFDDALAILTDDVAAETPGGTARGLAAVVDQARRNHPEDTGTQHVIANAVIDLDGDRAHAGANLIATFFDAARPSAPRLQLGERYRLDLVRTPDGWRISAVRTSPLWVLGEPLRSAP
jgi:hypothetical protein